MSKQSLKAHISHKLKSCRSSIRPAAMKMYTSLKRSWKKYHLTKLIILGLLTVALFFSVYLAVMARSANINALRAGLEQRTTIMDENGEEAGALFAQKGSFTRLENISPHIADAVVSTEDQRFFSHRGFDPIGLGRAAVGFVINRGQIVGGGSTLTQQLAKNAFLSQDQTMMRKLRELFLAIEIEKHYSKEDILEMYLNHAYFGNGVWGVEDASLRYFGKSSSDVTIGEAATIAGMLKAPSHYNPIDNYERSISRRNVVLSLMENTGAITSEERRLYQESGLTLIDRFNRFDGYRYPFYFDAVIDEATRRHGFSEEELMNDGYTIYTNLNRTFQQRLDQIYTRDYLFETAEDGTPVQSASVILDPRTGGVNAIVGGRGDHTFRGFNRATHMTRQPGSAIKPLGVFAPALEAGFTPSSMLVDELRSYGDTDYTPTNLSGQYSGEMPMYRALADSVNAPAVWLLNELGLRRGMRKVEQFGLSVSEDDNHLGAIALGGMDRGVSPLQLASAYSVFPNDGVRYQPHFITKIVDANGAVVVDNTRPRSERVVSSRVANEMNSMLLSVFEHGTGRNIQPGNFSVAGKTGTTQTESGRGATDQWVVGYTPDLVMASWMGYDHTTDAHFLRTSTAQGIGQVFREGMEAVLPHTEQSTFLVEEAGIAFSAEEPTMFDRLNETLEEAGNALREGTSVFRERTEDLFRRFRNRQNGE
ncbi:Multimodular transpeptidase-transglycosylase [Alkalibacterium sp. AK22]|uniref:PBP1A family penicillin-binding protein n=1 Tax=Alkalibacterium sp. AK22 TaxID=1229520 RepID=UPI00044DDBC3|nr:PBP1A family penicillin-binding protein [Alkalibacterium sp. AK22]EXJ22345.1 Multimodular transpeptidase-transglycosylase [Alkalibacterium sp. AK22]